MRGLVLSTFIIFFSLILITAFVIFNISNIFQYFDVKSFIVSNEVERHAINLANSILSSNISYFDSLNNRLHRALIKEVEIRKLNYSFPNSITLLAFQNVECLKVNDLSPNFVKSEEEKILEIKKICESKGCNWDEFCFGELSFNLIADPEEEEFECFEKEMERKRDSMSKKDFYMNYEKILREVFNFCLINFANQRKIIGYSGIKEFSITIFNEKENHIGKMFLGLIEW